MVIAEIKGLADGLKTSLSLDSDIIQLNYTYKFYICINFFPHQTTVIDC